MPPFILRNLTLVQLDHDLPGVFEGNPFGTAINGSLWTLFYEIVCYLGILGAGGLGLFGRPQLLRAALIIAVAVFATMPYLHFAENTRLSRLAELGLPFAIGTGFYVWRAVLPLNRVLAAGLAGLTVLLHGTFLFLPVLVLGVSYLAFLVGYWPHRPSKMLHPYNRLGDYSCGMYIYAFPIQQAGVTLGLDTPLANIAFALPLTLVFAVLSWPLVEGPALKLKRAPGRMAQTGASSG